MGAKRFECRGVLSFECRTSFSKSGNNVTHFSSFQVFNVAVVIIRASVHREQRCREFQNHVVALRNIVISVHNNYDKMAQTLWLSSRTCHDQVILRLLNPITTGSARSSHRRCLRACSSSSKLMSKSLVIHFARGASSPGDAHIWGQGLSEDDVEEIREVCDACDENLTFQRRDGKVTIGAATLYSHRT